MARESGRWRGEGPRSPPRADMLEVRRVYRRSPPHVFERGSHAASRTIGNVIRRCTGVDHAWDARCTRRALQRTECALRDLSTGQGHRRNVVLEVALTTVKDEM